MLRNGLLAVVSIVVGLLAVEIGLRSYDPYRFRSGWRTTAEMNFKPPSGHVTNQLGFRGKRIDYTRGDRVILLLGDSQVECEACPDGRLPEDFLQSSLLKLGKNVQVFSLGAGGYGPDQELLALREYFSRGYRADVVLLWQTLANDMWNCIFPQSSTRIGIGHLKPTFLLEHDQLEEPSSGIGGFFCRLYLACVAEQSTSGGIERRFVSHLPPPNRPLPAPLDPSLPVYRTREDVAEEKTHWSIWLEPDSPRKLYGIKLLNRLEREIANDAQGHGAKFFVFDVDRYTPEGQEGVKRADVFRPGAKYVQYRDRAGFYLAGGKEEYFRVSSLVNEGLRVFYVPLTIPDHVVSEQNVHLNQRGNKHVMSKLAADLVGEL